MRNKSTSKHIREWGSDTIWATHIVKNLSRVVPDIMLAKPSDFRCMIEYVAKTLADHAKYGKAGNGVTKKLK